MNNLPKIDPRKESIRIIDFTKTTLRKQNFKNVVIGLSGGVDSALCFALLKESIAPENIFVAHLYYFQPQIDALNPILQDTKIPPKNIYNISIKSLVDEIAKTFNLAPLRASFAEVATKAEQGFGGANRLRFGNIMARVRMILLYDLAKKHNALVCGTENKSEFYLGYFTRFGDEASDFEPIRHLYKTQVYKLAEHAGIPKNIINQTPTAGLWEGQTDEGEFGFSYKEADQVLYLYFEKSIPLPQIISKGFPNAEKIIERAKQNAFKHNLPYKVK
ncbi:MAG: NAD(+) synthase [Candidatus Levybacteria bacterium]|nr:NAD(+) synthase [Candidatus Levybacteria bacterium]